ELEAWMPEKIAAYKLRGFVQAMGAEVIESVPGRIRVRLAPVAGRRSLAWLGLGRRAGHIEMELQLQPGQTGHENLLRIQVLMRSPQSNLLMDPEFRARCDQIFCDLRGYLMGKTGVTDAVG